MKVLAVLFRESDQDWMSSWRDRGCGRLATQFSPENLGNRPRDPGISSVNDFSRFFLKTTRITVKGHYYLPLHGTRRKAAVPQFAIVAWE